jgi:hypothetical protein
MAVTLKEKDALTLYGAILKQAILKLFLVTLKYQINLLKQLFETYQFQKFNHTLA